VPFNISYLELHGGSVLGTGSLNIFGSFGWYSGSILVPTQIYGGGNYFNVTAGTKTLDTTTITVSVDSSISGNITFTTQSNDPNQRPTIINNGDMTFNNVHMTMGQIDVTGALINNGELIGTLSLSNGIDLVNTGQIGADKSDGNPITVINIAKGGLILSSTSVINLDIFAASERSSITVTGNFSQAGILNIRIRTSFVALEGDSYNFITYGAGSGLIGGMFAETNVDKDDWTNAGGCKTAAVSHDTTKRAYVLTFSGCASAPSPPVTVRKSNVGTILIVVFVVFVAAVVVGTIAWCKKKYRKRPWDRLRGGDRLDRI